MSTKLNRRRLALAPYLSAHPTHILEIGALATPTLPEHPDVSYLDWFSREELIASLEHNKRYGNAVVIDPDYVAKTTHFSDVVGDKFDLVIANHVLEHVPDPITWLDQVHRMTVEGGHLFMALPDRRFTFDFLRTESAMEDLLRAHDGRLKIPDFEQVLEHIYFHRRVTERDFQGEVPWDILSTPRFTFEEAVQRARAMMGRYVDVHCHVFTYHSFLALITHLASGGLVKWRIVESTDVQSSSNEFFVVLGRV